MVKKSLILNFGIPGRKSRPHEVEVEDTTPNSILDAINQLKASQPLREILGSYTRIDFTYKGEKINLTNPLHDGEDAHPFYTQNVQGATASHEFCRAYYAGRNEYKLPDAQEPGQPRDKSQPFLSDPSWYPQDPSRVVGVTRFYNFSDNPVTIVHGSGHQYRSGDAKDWQARWDQAMRMSQAIQEADDDRTRRRADLYRNAYGEYSKSVSEVSKSIFNWPQAIFRVLITSFRMMFQLLSTIPEEIPAMVQRIASNITLVLLSVERVIHILSGLLDYATRAATIASQFDWEAAIQVVNQLAREQQQVIKEGQEIGVLDQSYNVNGPEHWQVPLAEPNTPEEFRKYMALSALSNSLVFGPQVQAQMRFEMLRQYQQNTGVGIPNETAWFKYILNDPISTTATMQEAADMAGQIPDWFLGKTKQIAKMAKPIHEAQHDELKQLKH